MLNEDGSYATDASGEYVPTYDNDDIMSFARVWTGFVRQGSRRNINDANNAKTKDATMHAQKPIKRVWYDKEGQQAS